MTKKSTLLVYLMLSALIMLLVTIYYLSTVKSVSKENQKIKNQLVKLSSLPDLALGMQEYHIRHRTLTDIFSIYQNDGVLREYSIGSFTYSNSHILNYNKLQNQPRKTDEE